MPNYATKFTTRAVDEGYQYQIAIEQDGWGGDVTDLAPSDGFFEEQVGKQGQEGLAEQPIQVSSVQFAVDATPGLLDELFDAPDLEYGVTVERRTHDGTQATGAYSDYWRGFLVTDFYEDEPFEKTTTISLEAIDGLAFLQDRPYEPPERGETIQAGVERVLSGLNALGGIEVEQAWEPGGNEYDVAEPVWKNLVTTQGAWRKSEEEDLWRSEWDFLNEVLKAFGQTLRQSGFAWHFDQRSTRVQSPPAKTRDASGYTSRRGTRRTMLQRIGRVEATYVFGEVFEGLIENPGFENPLSGNWELFTHQDNENLEWGAEVIHADDSGKTPDATQENEKQLKIYYRGSGAKSESKHRVAKQDLPISVRQGRKRSARLSWEGGDYGYSSLLRPWIRLKIGGFYLSKTKAYVVRKARKAKDGVLPVKPILPGGTGDIVPSGTRLPVFREKTREDDYPEGEQVGYITLSEPVSCGDARLHGEISPDIADHDDITYVPIFYWTNQKSEPRVHELFTNGDVGVLPWERMGISAFLRTPGGTPVTGDQPSIELGGYFGRVNTTTLGLSIILDNFKFELLQEGEPITRQSSTALAESGGSIRLEPTRLGDGPTSRADTRIQAWHDNQGLIQIVDRTSDWGVGDEVTQLSLSQLRAREALRQRRKQVEVRNVTFLLRDGQDLLPHEVVEWDGALWDIGYYRRRAGGRAAGRVTVELRKLEDFGTGGISYQYAQSAEPTSPGTVNVVAGASNASGTGPSGTIDWDDVVGKDRLVNTFENRSGDVSLLESDVTGALGYTPANATEVVPNARTVEVKPVAGQTTVSPSGAQALSEDVLVNIGLADHVRVAGSIGIEGGPYFQEDGGWMALRSASGGYGAARFSAIEIVDGAKASRIESQVVEVLDSLFELNSDATGDGWGGFYLHRGPALTNKGVVWSPAQQRFGAADVADDAVETGSFVPLALNDASLQDSLNSDQWHGWERPDYLDQDVRMSATPSFWQVELGSAPTSDVHAVPAGRTLEAGRGLGGGGSLRSDRRFDVMYGSTSGRAVEGDTELTVTTSAARPLDVSIEDAALGAGPALRVSAPQDLRSTATPTFAGLSHGGGVGTHIESDHWVDKRSGYAIGYDGRADFRRIYTDELVAKAFTVDLTMVLAGSDVVAKSASSLADPFTVPAAAPSEAGDGGSAALQVHDLPGQQAAPVFENGDWVRMRVIEQGAGLVILDVWGQVYHWNEDEPQYRSDGSQKWFFVRRDVSSAATGAIIGTEAPVVDYGRSGQGIIRRTVEGGTYGVVETWTGNPIDGANYEQRYYYGDLSKLAASQASGWGGYTDRMRMEEDILMGSLDRSAEWLEADGSSIALGSGAHTHAEVLGDVLTLYAPSGETVEYSGSGIEHMAADGTLLFSVAGGSASLTGDVHSLVGAYDLNADGSGQFADYAISWTSVGALTMQRGVIEGDVDMLGALATNYKAPSDEALVAHFPFDRSGKNVAGTGGHIAPQNDGYEAGPAGQAIINPREKTSAGPPDWGTAYGHYTYSVWFKTTGLAKAYLVGHSYGTTSDVGWSIHLRDGGRIGWHAEHDDGTRFGAISPGSYNDGEWHHVCVQRPAEGTVYLWVDGERVATGSMDDTDDIGRSEAWVHVGANGAGNHLYSGSLSEVRVYARYLSDGEVRSLYLNPSGKQAYLDGGTLLADTVDTVQLAADAVTAEQISIGSIKDIDEDAAVASDLFSGRYGDLSDTPTLKALAALDKIDNATYINDGVIITDHLATDAVTAQKIDVGDLFAQDISITGVLRAGNSTQLDDSGLSLDAIAGSYYTDPGTGRSQWYGAPDASLTWSVDELFVGFMQPYRVAGGPYDQSAWAMMDSRGTLKLQARGLPGVDGAGFTSGAPSDTTGSVVLEARGPYSEQQNGPPGIGPTPRIVMIGDHLDKEPLEPFEFEQDTDHQAFAIWMAPDGNVKWKAVS